MRLYLSSFLLGSDTDALVDLVGRGARCGLILNALDNQPQARERFSNSQSEALRSLSLQVEELDLRHFFDRPSQLPAALQQFDALWINGGHAFILRRAMKLSGMDVTLVDLLARDEIVYAGFSAAAVIVSDSLRGLEALGDPHDIPVGYSPEIEWTGLGILPFAIVVHHQSDHPASPAVEKEIEYYERSNIPYRTLRDGEALIVRDGVTSVVGKPTAPLSQAK